MQQYNTGTVVVNFSNLFAVKKNLRKEFQAAQTELEQYENQVASSYSFLSNAAKNQVTPEISRQCLMKLASVCSIGEAAEPIRQKVEELKVHLRNLEILEQSYHQAHRQKKKVSKKSK